MAHGFVKANQFAASASQSASAITTTISRSNLNRRGFDPRASNPTTKMKTNDKQLYNALAYFVIFGKQLKNTLEELTFAIQKSEEILLAQNLKTPTRSKK